MDCIFCKIVKKEIFSEFVLESSDLVCVNDINPKAPIHILIVSKAHIPSVKDLNIENSKIAGEMIFAAKKIAADKNLEGYKLIFNVGRKGGQVIDHLHLHLLGGWPDAPGKVEV